MGGYSGSVLKAVLFVAVVAVAIYFLTLAIERGLARRPRRTPRLQRPLGPDDDQDFIWELNKKRKRRNPEE